MNERVCVYLLLVLIRDYVCPSLGLFGCNFVSISSPIRNVHNFCCMFVSLAMQLVAAACSIFSLVVVVSFVFHVIVIDE